MSRKNSQVTLKSNLSKLDSHEIEPHEYDEIPELTDEALARATFKKAGRPKSDAPRQPISLRLPQDVLARWKATGPGWQTRMAALLAKGPRG